MIPEAAVEAAVEVLWDKEVSARDVRAALEAAAPHMLSHEREETRLAHLDAIVNARTVDKLNKAVESVLALVRDNDLNGVVIVNADRVRDAITKALQ